MRRFWMTMTYGCDRCRLEIPVLLEHGLEGPRDKDGPMPKAMREAYKKGPFTGYAGHVPMTADCRVVLPVPMFAAGCPDCQGPPPWRMDGATISHVRWQNDRVLSKVFEAGDDLNVPHFRYPDKPNEYHACGHFVWPERGIGL